MSSEVRRYWVPRLECSEIKTAVSQHGVQMVLASDYDEVVEERDRIRKDWEHDVGSYHMDLGNTKANLTDATKRIAILAAQRDAIVRERDLLLENGPPAFMSWGAKLVPINSAGMREVIDASVALEATVGRVKALRDLVANDHEPVWHSVEPSKIATWIDRALAPEVVAQAPLCGVCNTVSAVIMDEQHGFGRCVERRKYMNRNEDRVTPGHVGYPSWDRRKRDRRQ